MNIEQHPPKLESPYESPLTVWPQPAREEILIDETHAVMEGATLDRLSEYSASIPSGVYPGKMWARRVVRRLDAADWAVGWYRRVEGPVTIGGVNYSTKLV